MYSERKTRKTVKFVMYIYVILLQWLIESLNLTYLLLFESYFLQLYSTMYIGRYLFHEPVHDSHLRPTVCLSVSNSNKSLKISLKELVTIVYKRHEIIFLSTSRKQNFVVIQTKNGRLLISQFKLYNDKKNKKSNYIDLCMVIFMYNSMTGYQLVQRLSKNYTYKLHAITYKDKECLSAHWLSLYS